MGYEPHLTGMKADLSHPRYKKVLSRFHGFIDRLQRRGPRSRKLTLNGAGSHTLKIYEKDRTFNDPLSGIGGGHAADGLRHLPLRWPRACALYRGPDPKRYQKNPF